MRERWNRFHTTTPLSLTLCVVVLLGSIFLVTAALVEGRDDEDSDTCDNPPPFHHPQDQTLLLFPFDSIASTQDEAKRIAEQEAWRPLLAENDPLPRSFVVTTREQTQGRGTNGRSWMGQRGNVFCTIGIRQSDWIQTKIPLTLLPLKVGSLVARHVQNLLDECHPSRSGQDSTRELPMVTVKWPNDVLVNEQKISGILIESSLNGWFLIGIGINLAYAPHVAMTGPNRGRPATSISNLCSQQQTSSTSSLWGEKQAEQLGIDLAFDLHSFLLQPSTALGTQVLEDWKQWIDWDMELVMRDTPEQERVKMVGVLPDGRVQVQNVDNGRIRTLVSDYFL